MKRKLISPAIPRIRVRENKHLNKKPILKSFFMATQTIKMLIMSFAGF